MYTIKINGTCTMRTTMIAAILDAKAMAKQNGKLAIVKGPGVIWGIRPDGFMVRQIGR